MIHTVTLNPALDKVLFLKEQGLVLNCTNRAKRMLDTIGGKGTHVSLNLCQLGVDNCAFGLAYGANGREIMRALRQEGVDVRFVYNERANSRVNTLLIEENGNCTTVAEPGVVPTEQEFNDLLTAMKESIKPGDSLVLSGDASNCPPDVYVRILQELADKQLHIYLDASGPSLLQCLPSSPFFIKPNEDELSQICGRPLQSERDIIESVCKISEEYDIQIIAVTLGHNGSVVKMGGDIYRVKPPQVQVRNTIGCGDCFLSGMIYGSAKNLSPEESLRFATAASAANAESDLSFGFDEVRAGELLSLCKVEKI